MRKLLFAKGTATKDSGIAVVVEKIPGDYPDTMTMLWRLICSVNHVIEPILLTTAMTKTVSSVRFKKQESPSDPNPDPDWNRYRQ